MCLHPCRCFGSDEGRSFCALDDDKIGDDGKGETSPECPVAPEALLIIKGKDQAADKLNHDPENECQNDGEEDPENNRKGLLSIDVVGQGRKSGQYFREKLLALKDRHPNVVDVRGLGLLLGMKLNVSGESLVRQCMQRGFLINCIQENILRFIPPLIIDKKEIDALVDCLDELLGELPENHAKE